MSYNQFNINESTVDTIIIEDELNESLDVDLVKLIERTSFYFEDGDLKSDISWLDLIYSLGKVYTLSILVLLVIVVFIISTICIFYPLCKSKLNSFKEKKGIEKEIKRKSLSLLCQSSENEYRSQLNSFFGNNVEPIIGYPPSPYAYLSSIRNR